MKTLIIAFLYSSAIFSRSVVPDRVITPPLDLYSTRNETLENGDQLVRITTFNKYGKFIRNGGKVILAKEKYQQYLNSSDAVFEMIPSQIGANEERSSRRGTAFSIGHNLVLTNFHVLDTHIENPNVCSDFELENHSGDKFDCKQVHYCHIEQDICLIEMKTKTKTKRDCLFCTGIKYEISLAEGPSLKLIDSLPNRNSWDSIVTAIGNSAGFGIHLSQGRGLFLSHGQLKFYAPITGGNSGGPLLNEENQVIGIVKRETTNKYSTNPNESYNIAAPIGAFIKAVRENLVNNPEILDHFNSAVIE